MTANGTPGLAGQCLVEMVPDLAPVIPFAGAEELKLDDLMMSALAPPMHPPASMQHDCPNVPQSPLEVPGPLSDWGSPTGNGPVSQDPFVNNVRPTPVIP